MPIRRAPLICFAANALTMAVLNLTLNRDGSPHSILKWIDMLAVQNTGPIATAR
jgi:hypothetical protein